MSGLDMETLTIAEHSALLRIRPQSLRVRLSKRPESLPKPVQRGHGSRVIWLRKDIQQAGLRKMLLCSAVALLMASYDAQAGGFNPVDWFMQKTVEDAAEKTVEDAVVKAAKDALTGKAKSGPAARSGDKKDLLAGISKVSGKDYLALPLIGPYRFAVPKDVPMEALPVGHRGGYVDRFGNEWVPIREKTHGGVAVVRWLEFLSEDGRFRLGRLAKGDTLVIVARRPPAMADRPKTAPWARSK